MANGPALETNLHPFDMAAKALVKGELINLFAVVGALHGNLSPTYAFTLSAEATRPPRAPPPRGRTLLPLSYDCAITL